MKKITKNRLALAKETVRALGGRDLEGVHGGITGWFCASEMACPTHTCPSSICSMVSKLPGC